MLRNLRKIRAEGRRVAKVNIKKKKVAVALGMFKCLIGHKGQKR